MARWPRRPDRRPASEIVIRRGVVCARPFGERRLDRFEIGAIKRLGTGQRYPSLGDAIDEHVACFHPQSLAHLLWNGGLRLRRHLAEEDAHVLASLLLTVRTHRLAGKRGDAYIPFHGTQ